MKRKTLVLKIENGEVVVCSPIRFPSEKIDEFVISKVDWIRKKISDFEDTKEVVDEINNMEKIVLAGISYTVELLNDIKSITLNEDECKIMIPKKYYDHQKQKNAIIKWLKNYAYEFLQERLNHFSKLHSIQYSLFSLTNSKRKWGSCDWKKEIKLNFRLLFLSGDLIDYVVLHELCHTYYLDHSKDFWQTLEKYCKNPKEMRFKLKQHSHFIEVYR